MYSLVKVYKVFNIQIIMSNRLTLRISVILLAIGIGLVPTAYLTSGYMRDQVNAEIPRTFLIIRHGFANYLELHFIGLGIPEVLTKLRSPITRIHSMEDETIYDFLFLLNTIPHFLQMLKSNMVGKLPAMINASRTALFINQTITAVMNETSFSEAQVRGLFFNNFQFENDYDNASIEGISEYGLGTTSLNFTALASLMILDGDENYPGLIQDLVYGTGVSRWLDFYNLAEANIDNNRSAMESVYNCTWRSGQLQNVSNYIKSYMWDVKVKSLYSPETIDTYALETFYGQWANYSYSSNRLNLKRFIDPLNPNLLGFELVLPTIGGIPVPSGIPLSVCEGLWDPSNQLSFVNQSGLIKWFSASNSSFLLYDESIDELNSTFTMSLGQFQSITNWLFDTENANSFRNLVINTLIPLPKPYGFATSPIMHRENLFYAQWVNGTVVKGGLNLNLAGNLKGFEVGVPTRTNISKTIAKSFLTLNNGSSFMNKYGLFRWVQAYHGNITAQNELMNIFALSSYQLNLIIDWLFGIFKENIVSSLVLPLTGETLNQIAFDEYPLQWAYASFNESSIDLTDYTYTGFSFLGWELGLPTHLTLNISQTTALLDSSNSLSFTNRKGISIWLQSKEIPEYYYEIVTEFSLTSAEYTQIYEYIMYVKQSYVEPLLIQESPFHMDTYVISDMYQTGILIGAITIIAAGIVFGVFSFLKKKR